MRLSDIIPIRIRGSDVLIGISLITLMWGLELVVVAIATIGVVSVTSMDYITAIPAEMQLATAVAIAVSTILLGIVLFIASFQAKKTEILNKKKEAIAAGSTISEVELERVKNFNMVYAIALFIWIAVTASLSYLAVLVAPQYVHIDGPAYIYVAIFAVAIIGLFIDKVFAHPLADGTFKAKVIDPLQEKEIEAFQKAATSSSEDEIMAGLDDETRKLFELAKILKKLKD